MLKSPIRAALTSMASRLERASFDPAPAQALALRRIVAGCGASVAGRLAGLDRVRSTEDARALQATDSRSIEGLLEEAYRLGRDGAGIFGRSRIVAYGQTSGSTGKPKRLPVTADFLASYRRSSQLMNACVFWGTGEWESLFRGRALILAARPEVERASRLAPPAGFMSGIMMATAPAAIRRRFLPSLELLREERWEDKMDPILREARPRDVRMIAGVPPLVRSFTERALELFGVESLSEVWPNLGMLLYGGVALSPRLRSEIEALWLGDPPCGARGQDDSAPLARRQDASAPKARKKLHFWEIYAATEGQFGHTLRPEWPGMVFNPFENFYQFLEAGSGRFLQLHELEPGGRYAIHVITPGGLVNYRMGDWIEVLSVRPLTFRVCGRDGDELSLAGEKITPDQLERAVAEAQRLRPGLVLSSDYVVWAEEGRPNRLVWGLPTTVCEARAAASASERRATGSAAGRSLELAERLAEAVDEALGQVNPTYREMRVNDFLFGKPEVLRLDVELFRRYRESRLDQGQFKGKRLFRSREAFEREFGVT